MRTPYFLMNKIEESEKESFETDVVLNNIHRGKILAIIVIGIEAIYIFIALAALILKVDGRFDFKAYFTMYTTMIMLNVAYLLFFRKYEGKVPDNKRKQVNLVTVAYITLVMLWGSVVSLMDQRLYGHLVTYMVNLMVCFRHLFIGQ